jgi:hypothetical protein
MINTLKSLKTTRFIFGTAADWAASNMPLRAGDFALITDDPTRFKMGDGMDSIQGPYSNSGSIFSALPYINKSTASVKQKTKTAINATATALAADIIGGLITSTSAAAVALTLDTVANLVAALGLTSANARGTTLEFFVDNVLGANTVTVGAGTGMTTASAITGGTTLTVAAGARAKFELYFVSTAAAILARVI